MPTHTRGELNTLRTTFENIQGNNELKSISTKAYTFRLFWYLLLIYVRTRIVFLLLLGFYFRRRTYCNVKGNRIINYSLNPR